MLVTNDAGAWTRAAPSLYPHQWSWDAAFISMGWAHVDVGRAMNELDSLFRGQWRTGKVPHIVFDPDASPTSYFPGPDRWACAGLASDAPTDPPTSGICQPPAHALAVARIWEVASAKGGRTAADALAWLRLIYPRLFAWHRYLARERDPEGSGLVTIYHPWESGCDNSPRWDFLMGRLIVGEMPPYTRYDLHAVGDPLERPSDDEYDFYIWLVERLKGAHYADEAIRDSHPFLVKDVLFSALFVAANEALSGVARAVEAPRKEMDELARWAVRGRAAIRARAQAGAGLCYDHDLGADTPLPSTTIAAILSPLLAGGLSPELVRPLVDALDSTDFAGHPEFHSALPPTTSPYDPGFRPRSYWRGPVWPLINWLVWWGLIRAGAHERADDLRGEALAQVERRGFAEYFEPFSGEPLGSSHQSWTAAVVLDWLAARGD